MKKEHRRQITLFVPDPIRQQIESIRKRYNPIQFNLIAAHVTLCRDDEVGEWTAIQSRARQLESLSLPLQFGKPKQDHNLVFLPAIGSTKHFEELRRQILGDSYQRQHHPHITLIHPRNGACSTADYARIRGAIEETRITFARLTFIEKFGDSPWTNIVSFPINR